MREKLEILIVDGGISLFVTAFFSIVAAVARGNVLAVAGFSFVATMFVLLFIQGATMKGGAQ
jgi:hypothetical protein